MELLRDRSPKPTALVNLFEFLFKEPGGQLLVKLDHHTHLGAIEHFVPHNSPHWILLDLLNHLLGHAAVYHALHFYLLTDFHCTFC